MKPAKNRKTCPKCGGTNYRRGACTLCQLLKAGAAANVVGGCQRPEGWPLCSEALGVLPKDVEKQMQIDRRNGVPTNYTRGGRAVLTDPRHRMRLIRSRKFHDKNGGYSE